MKTVYSYYGGKARLVDVLLPLIPPHDVYVEPFFGSGALFYALPQQRRHAILNDRDDWVVTFLRVLRDQPEELERVCALTPHSRTEFGEARTHPAGLPDLEIARRFWVQINQSFGKTTHPHTGWSWTVARTPPIPSTIRSRLGRFGEAAERLMEATLENRDAVELLAGLDLNDRAFLYIDSPYVHSTRTQTGGYSHEMDDEHHRALAAALHRHAASGATVLVSGYDSPLYTEIYPCWHRTSVDVICYSSNARTHHREARTEVLWCNRPVFDRPGWEQLQLA